MSVSLVPPRRASHPAPLSSLTTSPPRLSLRLFALPLTPLPFLPPCACLPRTRWAPPLASASSWKREGRRGGTVRAIVGTSLPLFAPLGERKAGLTVRQGRRLSPPGSAAPGQPLLMARVEFWAQGMLGHMQSGRLSRRVQLESGCLSARGGSNAHLGTGGLFMTRGSCDCMRHVSSWRGACVGRAWATASSWRGPLSHHGAGAIRSHHGARAMRVGSLSHSGAGCGNAAHRHHGWVTVSSWRRLW